MDNLSVHWFRNDLRIHDNPALSHAPTPLIGLYIFEDEENTVQKVWLHDSIQKLQASLHALNIPLLIGYGDPIDVWKKLLKTYPIAHISWSTSFEPDGIKRDATVRKLLSDIPVTEMNGTHLLDPTALVTSSGNFYKVFTPFWKMHQKVYHPEKSAAHVKPNKHLPKVKLDTLKPLHKPLIHLDSSWEPGEEGAHKRLKHFVHESLRQYEHGRDYPALSAHSRLSPHLHFGEISPHAVARATFHNKSFHRELIFRDFAMQLLYHIPHLNREPMKPQFANWRWDDSAKHFEAWKEGKTGFPIVDAGMRELFHTGFMHNRVRMIVASFLVKDLNIPWQKGADWFLKRLLDADLALNSFNWQWSAGTGPDAQPFFRIFNPLLQSKKFDSDGTYIRQWVPELSNVASSMIHAPSKDICKKNHYPEPLVDHDQAKKAALKEFHRVA